MFARLSMGAAHLLNVSFQASSSSILEEEEEGDSVLQVDLRSLQSLMNPSPENTWRRVIDICQSSISPVYESFRTMVSDDIERMTHVLLELESADEELDSSPISTQETDGPLSTSPDNALGPVDFERRGCLGKIKPRECGKRHPSIVHTASRPIVIPSSHPSAPTIIITPCPSGPRETSCRVPYQNDAFGKMLTVPSHPVFNKLYPPMVPLNGRTPILAKWIWRGGHWEAVVPSLEEQSQKGLFSRVHLGRRKASRAYSTA